MSLNFKLYKLLIISDLIVNKSFHFYVDTKNIILCCFLFFLIIQQRYVLTKKNHLVKAVKIKNGTKKIIEENLILAKNIDFNIVRKDRDFWSIYFIKNNRIY